MRARLATVANLAHGGMEMIYMTWPCAARGAPNRCGFFALVPLQGTQTECAFPYRRHNAAVDVKAPRAPAPLRVHC